MFLFKITFPILGTATVGAVGTGIYYGIKQGKEASELKDKNEVRANGQTQEKGPKPTITPEEAPTLPQPEPDSEEKANKLTESPQVEVSVHSEPLEK